VDKPDKKHLSDVLSSIREMVQKETRAKISEELQPAAEEKPAGNTSTSNRNLPSKILILRPHMRVYPSKRKTVILEKSMRVPHDTPIDSGDSFAIANPAIDEGMLRDMVREVVQEQLRGELGKEIVGAIKRDMVLLLEKNR